MDVVDFVFDFFIIICIIGVIIFIIVFFGCVGVVREYVLLFKFVSELKVQIFLNVIKCLIVIELLLNYYKVRNIN